MANERKADYQRLYELAARKVDKQRSDRRKAVKGDSAAGKISERRVGSVPEEYKKLANAYEKKNKLYAAPGESPRDSVLKENNIKQMKASKRINQRIWNGSK